MKPLLKNGTPSVASSGFRAGDGFVREAGTGPVHSRIALGFMSDPAQTVPRKRLFIGLVVSVSIILCLLLLLGWVIPLLGLGNIHVSVPYVTGALLVITIFIIVWAALDLVLQILTGRSLWGADKMRGLSIRCFLPLMELLGRGIGYSRSEIRRSFIKVNNQLTMARRGQYSPREILILLPHCLQNVECTLRVSIRPNVCQRCGQCPLAGLLQLRDMYGVKLAVATGGSIARQIVVKARPRLIIAVACERDLASGIHDTHPLPVFGVLNHCPEGPCHNTQVSCALVEEALCYFITAEHLSGSS